MDPVRTQLHSPSNSRERVRQEQHPTAAEAAEEATAETAGKDLSVQAVEAATARQADRAVPTAAEEAAAGVVAAVLPMSAEEAEAATVFPAREDREAPAVPVLTAVMLRAAAVLSMRPGFVQETAAAALSSSHIMQTR